ncbi:hypothetical protein SDC9_157343 [bioreactor metagenome]|uniref:Uncharacterized protein n=1 Tax=bioreactor metagenome TaxID=1076179 RepID=A0A645F825_9ZZZZ
MGIAQIEGILQEVQSFPNVPAENGQIGESLFKLAAGHLTVINCRHFEPLGRKEATVPPLSGPELQKV